MCALGVTALFAAVNANQTDAVEFLLKHGADVELTDDGFTPIIVAADYGYVYLVKLLLTHGANPDARPRFNSTTALIRAARRGHLSVVRQLLKHGVDVDARDKDGRTAIWLAAFFGHEDVVRILAQAPARIDAADNIGATPLMAASQENHVGVIQILLDADANKEKKDDKGGYTPLLYAAEMGMVEAVAFLIRRGAKLDAASKVQLSHLIIFSHISVTLLPPGRRDIADPGREERPRRHCARTAGGGSRCRRKNSYSRPLRPMVCRILQRKRRRGSTASSRCHRGQPRRRRSVASFRCQSGRSREHCTHIDQNGG